MTTISYQPIKEEYKCGEQCRISYGIAAYAHEAETQTATVVASVHDLSASFAEVLALTELCNRQDLSVLHLRDVAEDFLAN